MEPKAHFVRWFNNINKEDLSIVGSKAASLGDIYNQGFPVPNGFVITPSAYYHFLKDNKLDVKIKHILSTANFDHLHSLHQISGIIKRLIAQASYPNELVSEIILAYKKLKEPIVAIKFSEASDKHLKSNFIQYPQAILNIQGDAVLLEKIKQVWASVFDSREIFYRHNQGMEQIKTDSSLIIQEMVEAEKSGSLYSVNPGSNEKNKILIKAILGLGELIAQTQEETDIYEVDKIQLNITKKFIAHQKNKLIKSSNADKLINVSPNEGKKQKISDFEILELAKLGLKIENYYYFPQKIEWAIVNNKIFIVQALPITDIKENDVPTSPTADDLTLRGVAANKGIACGPVRIVLSQKDAEKVEPQEVVVIKEIKSSFLQIFKKASAIVIENADKNIQILFNSNELRLPCVTAVNNATTVLKQNEIITVNGTKGEIYKGGFSIKPNKYQESMISDKKIATKLFVNFKNKNLPENITLDATDGACILNADSFIVKLGVHPKKLIRDNKQNLLITSISDYLISTCKLFDLKPVIYQISNLTTNDYRNLEGGSEFEHVEENPNMGMRGAFRHIHDSQSFKLELDAIKKARNALAFKNLWIIIPFVRTVEELKALKQIINESGLQRSTNFRVFMSVDIPSNIIMLEKFIEAGIDGIFINSGLLSSLLTGTDKNNYEITAENNKYNDSLRWTLEKIIKTAGVTSTTTLMLDDNLPNIQGLMKDLVSWGLSGLCVDAETIIQAKKTLIQAEKEYINNIDGKN